MFGREDRGLTNEELAKCDLVVTIPANPEYPILNLSHAASIILYEIYKAESVTEERERIAGRSERDLVIKYLEEIMDILGYPAHRRNTVKVVFNRLMVKSSITSNEAFALIGFLRRLSVRLRNVIANA